MPDRVGAQADDEMLVVDLVIGAPGAAIDGRASPLLTARRG
ncbi:MAG: hypothetical protein ACTH6N_08550 [Brachybacterium tyrofermentans]|nr:hypothetical protein [Brachybacterium tyrofermentans]